MPLTFASPPSDCLPALQQGLQTIWQAQALDASGGASALAVPSASQAMRPHPVYNLGLDGLAAGQGLESAELVAWRYLLVTNNQVKQAAEVNPPQGGNQSRFNMLTTGYVAGAEQAFAIADQLPDIQQRPYEIRALRSPALYFMALWLKDSQGRNDLFIVLPPAFAPLQALRVYTTTDLLPLLQRMAAQKAPLEQRVVPA